MTFTKTGIAIVLTSFIATGAQADNRQSIQAAKGGATFIGGAVAGAMIGGPIGMILGGIGGGLLAEEGQDKLEQTIVLEQTEVEMNMLEQQVDDQEFEIKKLEKMIAEKMRFQMYFKTGEDELAIEDQEQIRALADFLNENDYMHVSIDGHTDPRGTDEYNAVLSNERAKSVATILEENGIDASRLSVKGHGSSFANTNMTSVEEFASQRKVNVQVFSSKGSASLASAN
jgi:outer membrane protein OmpA-like peptidoglycan-associated protein